jgi:hypothetical protein
MDSLIASLLKAGPAYILAAVLLWILISDRKACREHLKERDAKIDALADKLYEVALEGVKKDTEVLATLEQVRRDVDRLGASGGPK